MATPAIQLAVPAPANASFVNGEMAVGVAAPAPGTTYHFSRNFFAKESGLYILKLWMAGSGAVKTGRNLASLQTLLQPPANQVIQTQIYFAKGVNRIDVVTASGSSAFFAMLVYHPDEVAYASSDDGWVYDTSAIPDAQVPAADEGTLPVFSLLPNWADGVGERLSYLTDLLSSESATEQARLLRLHPRRTLEANFLRKGVQRSRLDNFLAGIGRRMFWLPLWHEQFRPTAGVSATDTYTQFPAGTLKWREFQVGDRVLVNNKNPDEYEVLRVGSLDYDTDRLYWAASASQDWLSGSRIMPLRRARVVDQTQLANPSDAVGRVGIEFELVDPEYRFGAAWGVCAPVWNFTINRAEDVSFAYDRQAFVLDNNVAAPVYKDTGGKPLVTMRSSLTLRGREKAVAYRRFIDMASGRAGRFWMPTMMGDIHPASGSIGGLTLDAQPSGFTDFFTGLQDARSVVAIRFDSNLPPVYRTIIDVQRIGQVERFTFDRPLPSVPTLRVKRIEFLVASRFDQDSFDFKHLVDDSAAITTSVVTRSVDSAGMEEPDC